MKFKIIFPFLLFPVILFGQGISGSWSEKSSTGFTPRAALTSAVVKGKIYVMGGYSNDTTFLNTLEVFDPSTNLWSTPQTAGVFSPRRGLCSAVVKDKLYVMGGYDGKNWLNKLEVYDPSDSTWSTPVTSGTFTPREKLCCSVVDDKIFVMGGYNGIQHFNLLEVFDPSTNTWTTPITTGTFTPRRGLASAVVNGKIYVMGGFNGTDYLNTFEVYDPASHTWSTPVTTGTFSARGALAASVVDGKIYAMGGIHYVGGAYHNVNIVEVFDSATKSWSTPTTTGTFSARELLTSSVVDGAIYALGGNNGIFLNTNEEYIPAKSNVKSLGVLQDILLYPNPTTGKITLHQKSGEVLSTEVTNILGEEVMKLNKLADDDITLDLSMLANGVYYIRCSSSNSLVTKAIIKN